MGCMLLERRKRDEGVKGEKSLLNAGNAVWGEGSDRALGREAVESCRKIVLIQSFLCQIGRWGRGRG